MVSKGKILGKSSLIFVTIGTTNFQFERLFLAVDRIVTTTNRKLYLIVQTGNSYYKWQYDNLVLKSYITPKELISYIKKAERIITHAGSSTLYLIAKYAKNTPLVIARQSKYQEIVDAHQVMFIKFLKKKLPAGIRKFFVEKEDVEEEIKNYITNKPTQNKLFQYLFYGNNKDNLINQLDNFITSLV